MGEFGILFGFAGMLLGAVITFVTEMIIRKSQMSFDMSVEVRKTLISLNDKLVDNHSNIQNVYDNNEKRTEYSKIIIEMKKIHEDVMERYKTYRIHLGDNSAYELQSGVYNYFYKRAKAYVEDIEIGSECSKQDYEESYQALKDAFGLMINDVRFELIKINSIKKISKTDRQKKYKEYNKYAKRLNVTLNFNLLEEITSFDSEGTNTSAISKSMKVLVERIAPFKKEHLEVKRRIKA